MMRSVSVKRLAGVGAMLEKGLRQERILMLRFLMVFICCIGSAHADDNPPAPGFDAAGSDPEAIALADEAMTALGGRANWDATRYITWRFFGFRLHVWDKWTGDIRFEQGDLTVLMNIHSREGRAFAAGVEIVDPDTLGARLEQGYRAWINDSYWLVMPYKLKDTGVTLRFRGPEATGDGRPADVLELTFRDVGVTPENKYAVWIDRESRLVTQWAFYREAGDAEPAFTGPWTNWKRHGSILLSDGRGERRHTDVAVFDELPRSVFTSSAPVELPLPSE